MHSRIFKAGIAVSAVLSPIMIAGVSAQSNSSQMERDSEKKIPAVADASLARDDAKTAKRQAMKAERAAGSPKARSAAKAAAKAADAAANEANAATREAAAAKKGPAPR